MFHQIGPGGGESAEVRKFLVDNGLTDLVDFQNLKNANAQATLNHLLGSIEAPVLVVDSGRVLRGRAAIVDWLKTNVLCLRD